MVEKFVTKITGTKCLKGYPCKHSRVKIHYSDGFIQREINLDGYFIALLFQKHNLTIPQHFIIYLQHGNENYYIPNCWD